MTIRHASGASDTPAGARYHWHGYRVFSSPRTAGAHAPVKMLLVHMVLMLLGVRRMGPEAGRRRWAGPASSGRAGVGGIMGVRGLGAEGIVLRRRQGRRAEGTGG